MRVSVPCKRCGSEFERSEDLANRLASNAIDGLFGPTAPTTQAKLVSGMLKGLLAEQTEESLLSVCTRCEPALALIRICLEEQDPTVVMLKFALEVAQQKATQNSPRILLGA